MPFGRFRKVYKHWLPVGLPQSLAESQWPESARQATRPATVPPPLGLQACRHRGLLDGNQLFYQIMRTTRRNQKRHAAVRMQRPFSAPQDDADNRRHGNRKRRGEDASVTAHDSRPRSNAVGIEEYWATGSPLIWRSQMGRNRTAFHLPRGCLRSPLPWLIDPDLVAVELWCPGWLPDERSRRLFRFRSVPDGLSVYVARAGQPDTIFRPGEGDLEGRRTPVTLRVEAGASRARLSRNEGARTGPTGRDRRNRARRSSGLSL